MSNDEKAIVLIDYPDMTEELLRREEAEISDRALMEAGTIGDRRRYFDRVHRRMDIERHRLLAAHGLTEGMYRLLRELAEPGVLHEAQRLLASVDLPALQGELGKIRDRHERVSLMQCNDCGEVFQISELTVDPISGMSHRCNSCLTTFLGRPSTPAKSGIRSALARARAARLPATLTEEEWARTVEFFEDRCAYCGSAWSIVEHATSIELGGGTTAGNCLPACVGCNNRKASTMLEHMTHRYADPERIRRALEWLRQCGRQE